MKRTIKNHTRLKYCILGTRKGGFLCPQCKKIYETFYYHIDSGKSTKCKSCAAGNKNRTHGQSDTKLYSVYGSMKDRCYRKNTERYIDYGGRGIRICDKWLYSFQSFYKWAMENGYRDGLTIDREDNNGNYSPNNCRWVDRYIQASNTRTQEKYDVGVTLAYDGKFKSRVQMFGMSYYLGIFKNKEDAINARKEKKMQILQERVY